jgi:hypothetical protein
MMKKKNNEIDVAKYYEETDFSSLIKREDVKIIRGESIKRITMNISDKSYEDANEIDGYINLGYQNVLKVAIALGLNDLRKAIIEGKDIKKILKTA